MNNQKLQIAIIGAGASGLATSIFLDTNKMDVTIFEKNNKIGKKLLATGNGKCNVTNKNISPSNFHSNSSNINSIKKLLNKFDFVQCKNFFQSLGVEFLYRENGRAYPMSSSSATIVDALTFKANQSNVDIKLNFTVEGIDYINEKYIIDNKAYDILIIATGSNAMQKLGGTLSGYQISESLNHSIIPPIPSLVQLIAQDSDLNMISGVKLTATVNNRTGDILFTNYGISGSAILDISRDIAIELQLSQKVNISIDLTPSFSKEKLKSLLLQRVKTNGEKEIMFWLDGIFHKKLSNYIIKKAKLNKTIKYGKELSTKDINKLIHLIKNLPFSITDTRGFEHCEVCSGGVNLTEIDLNTMASKNQKNLYIIGEVLDIDGECGGYNLHFAWASGYCAAQAINKTTLQ